LGAVVEELYDSEINCGFQTFWDAGCQVWIGDPANGRQASASFPRETIHLAASWLHERAIGLYPKSAYAKAHA
jgi:hypothetical protein